MLRLSLRRPSADSLFNIPWKKYAKYFVSFTLKAWYSWNYRFSMFLNFLLWFSRECKNVICNAWNRIVGRNLLTLTNYVGSMCKKSIVMPLERTVTPLVLCNGITLCQHYIYNVVFEKTIFHGILVLFFLLCSACVHHNNTNCLRYYDAYFFRAQVRMYSKWVLNLELKNKKHDMVLD